MISGAIMDRKRAWMVPAFTGAILIVTFFISQGGLAGLARDPRISLPALGVMILVAIPMLWLSYRRMRRDPILVGVREIAEDVTVDERLGHPPIVLSASRWKTLLRVIYIAVVGAIFIGISLLQQGVCRAVSLIAYAPLVIWSFVTAAICLWRPERLELRPEGLRHIWLWLDRRWTWNELREITLIKRQIPFFGWFCRKRPTASLYFKRYQPAGQAIGPARAGFQSIWIESGENVAQLLESARVKWSTPAGDAFVQVPGSYRQYVRTAVVLVIVFGVMWMWVTQPCGS